MITEVRDKVRTENKIRVPISTPQPKKAKAVMKESKDTLDQRISLWKK